jgi:hypothetical protein
VYTVDMLVQPFGMESPVPPIEYEILEDKIEKNLRYNDRPASTGVPLAS